MMNISKRNGPCICVPYGPRAAVGRYREVRQTTRHHTSVLKEHLKGIFALMLEHDIALQVTGEVQVVREPCDSVERNALLEHIEPIRRDLRYFGSKHK